MDTELLADYSGDIKKKEVSWNDKDYLEKVKLEDTSVKCQPCMLERKTSLGPCFLAAAPFGRPSGISICSSKKLPVNIETDEYNPKKSVINITLSNKCLLNKTIHREVNQFDDQNKQIQKVPKLILLGALRKRMANMSDKIRNAFV